MPMLAEAYSRNKVLDQAQRRIQTTERSYRQTLKQIRQMQKEDQGAREKEAHRKRDQEMIERARAEASAQVRRAAARQVEAETGLIYVEEEDAFYPRDPKDAAPK
jgi:hypothetical protein